MRNFLETRQTTAGKNTGQCLTHLNKLTCEIWSCFDNVQFSQKLNLRFLPSRLQLNFFRLKIKFIEYYNTQNILLWYTGTPILALTDTAGMKLANKIKKLLCMSPATKQIMYHEEQVKKQKNKTKWTN